MRPFRIGWVLVLLSGTVSAQEMRSDLGASIAAVEAAVIEWRRDLHQHPELSNREFRTAGKVAEHLRRLRFDRVETEVAHTGVVGTLRGGKPGPVIALRADMDGLPVRRADRTALRLHRQRRIQRSGGQRDACLRT